MSEQIYGWHFVGSKLRDGRPVPKDGVWLRHEGQIKIYASGLHASRRPWNALQYAPGATLCYVECRGDVQEEIDKLVCRERRIIMRADVTETLRFFARMQALSVIRLHRECPPDVVLDYLMTGDESIRDAARAAAWDAANAAANAAAWAASNTAAWDASRAAANAAANAAAWDASNTAAWDAAGLDFDALIYEQFGVAA